MALTLEDLKDKLKQVDNVLLLEVLEISSDDLVERFEDSISAKYDWLVTEFEEDDEQEESAG